MPKSNQSGIAHILVIILLLIGLAAAVYLVQTKTNFLPKAASGPIEMPPPGGISSCQSGSCGSACLINLPLESPPDNSPVFCGDDQECNISQQVKKPNPEFQCAKGLTCMQTLCDPGMDCATIYDGGRWGVCRNANCPSTNTCGCKISPTNPVERPTPVELPQPVYYWNFDEGKGTQVKDLISGKIGTWYGSGQHWTINAFGRRALFNGKDDYILIPGVTFLGGKEPFAIAFKFIASSIPETQVSSLLSNENYQKSGFRYGIDNKQNYGTRNLFFWSVESGGTISNLHSSITIMPNTPYQAVVTFDGTEAKMYLNGKLVSGPQAGTIVLNSNPLIVGGAIGGKMPFNGSIDDLKIYNTALTPAQIPFVFDNMNETVYNSGGSGSRGIPTTTKR